MRLRIACPFCQHEMVLGSPKAGRFKPTCKKCGQAFQLTITLPIAAGQEFQAEVVRIEGSTTVPLAETRADVPPADTQPAFKPVVITAAIATGVAASGSSGRTEEDRLDQTIAVGEAVRAEQVESATAQPSPETRVERRNTTRSDAAAASNRGEGLGRLGGYRLLKELGQGGMGSVYLAKQLSLGREVAIKTIRGKWASNPRAIARFIREAYAAAQLVHHNVVQIYDLDEDKGTNFFSMELVTGGSIDELIKREGKLEPRRAATLLLQAARGLKFAHDHGMVHRDVKPANLMLNSEGLVKVADLGLVKTPSMSVSDDREGEENPLLASANSEVTVASSRMGTPAYMAPEQANDATSVDARADIYSLGCTFFAMLIGKPPFSSGTVEELISKHKTEPLVRPDRLVAAVPRDLGEIVERMTAKKPADRYSSMDEVIVALERFLGSGEGKESRFGSQLKQLEEASREFRKVPAGLVRIGLAGAFVAVAAFITLIGFLISWQVGLSSLIFAVATPLAALGLSMIADGEQPVSSRLRVVLRSAKWGDWLTWSVGFLLFVAIVYVLGIWLWALVALAAAIGAAVLGRLLLAQVIDQGRRGAVERVESVLRELRLEGMEENRIRDFLIEAAGKQWQELFEAVFDFEALQAKRTELVDAGGKAPKSERPWRDGFVARLEARVHKLKVEKDKQVLQKVEVASLRASGRSESEAAREAAQLAATLVEMADATRLALAQANQRLPEAEALARRARVKQMLADARGGKAKPDLDEPSQGIQGLLGSVLGGRVRFAVGAFLIVGCVFWLKQNELLDQAKIDALAESAKTQLEQAQSTIQSGDFEKIKSAGEATAAETSKVIGETRALSWPVVGVYFHSIFAGVMGLMIVLSSLKGGWRWTPIALVAVVLTLGLPLWGLPSFGIPSGSQLLAFLIGSGVLGLGLLLRD